MNNREWAEFGKMYEKLIEAGWEITVDSVTDDLDDNLIVFSITLCSKDEMIVDEQYYNTPYDAIKDAYYKNVLNILDGIEIELDLPSEVVETLYKLSDEKGIPLDEYVNDILKEMIPEPQKLEFAKCCFNCEAFKNTILTESGFCVIHQKSARNQLTCSEYIPSLDLI
jgi:hypothetical protein